MPDIFAKLISKKYRPGKYSPKNPLTHKEHLWRIFVVRFDAPKRRFLNVQFVKNKQLHCEQLLNIDEV